MQANNIPGYFKFLRRRHLWLGVLVIFLSCSVGVVFSLAGPKASGVGTWVQWPAQAKSGGSKAFWRHWGDGKAELSSYKASVERYGEMHNAELVLIYVTETMDRRTWIKNDATPKSRRVPVLKLNTSLKFQTGIYPYSALTSVFSPVSRWRAEPFSPAKMTVSVQDWCGHVFGGIWAGSGRLKHTMFSYFAGEGEKTRYAKTPKNVLYEDALLIQLRELDGSFAGGKDWKGQIIPSLWRSRKSHRLLRPQRAEIKRTVAKRNGKKVTRFTLHYSASKFSQVYDVELGGSKRILGWHNSKGEKIQLYKTKRLPYWGLHRNRDSHYRGELGLK